MLEVGGKNEATPDGSWEIDGRAGVTARKPSTVHFAAPEESAEYAHTIRRISAGRIKSAQRISIDHIQPHNYV